MAKKELTLRSWQKVIFGIEHEKGFDWSPFEIDTMLLRLHSEVSEAGEAARDLELLELGFDNPSRNEKLEHLAEEFADLFIRLSHYCECLKIDLQTAVEKKMKKNKTRPRFHGRARK